MASAIATDKIFSRCLLQGIDHDPGVTTAVIASPDGGTTKKYVDMRDYVNFAVLAIPSIVGGGGLTLLEIVAATDAAFTTPVQIKTSGVVAADAMGDYVVLECDEADLIASGTDLRYVAARLTNATNTDEVKVVYFAEAKRPTDGLTATTIA